VQRLPRGERLDRLVAIICVAWGQLDVWLWHTTPGAKWYVAPLSALAAAALAVRRRHPLAAVSTVVVAEALLAFGGGHPNSIPVAISYICVLYGLAVWTATRDFLLGCAVVVGSDALTLTAPNARASDAAPWAVVPVVAMLIGRRAIRERQLQADALAARTALLERERDLLAQQAVIEERARIARELHDLVAHNVSVMVVQAGAERHSLGPEASPTADVLASIEQTGRQALAEARRLLGVLRPGSSEERLEPQPGIDQIARLVEQVERAGLPVTVSVEGSEVALPAGLGLCAYRIVQESLTNVLKHAGPARAEVYLRYSPRSLDVVVCDDGRGSDGAGPAGHGLIGMRERVAMYGGTLQAGSLQGGGFEVSAHLPLA
jgi:signal transduction histidine kinase